MRRKNFSELKKTINKIEMDRRSSWTSKYYELRFTEKLFFLDARWRSTQCENGNSRWMMCWSWIAASDWPAVFFQCHYQKWPLLVKGCMNEPNALLCQRLIDLYHMSVSNIFSTLRRKKKRFPEDWVQPCRASFSDSFKSLPSRTYHPRENLPFIMVHVYESVCAYMCTYSLSVGCCYFFHIQQDKL